MLPESTSHKTEGDTFIIKHKDLMISTEEAYSIKRIILQAGRNPKISKIIIDNREAKGVWPRNINKIWEETIEEALSFNIKVASLTNSHTAAMQINRISRAAGISDISKAFFNDMNDEVRAFLNA